MAITINSILSWCRVAQASRAELTTMIMPGGLADLADFTPENGVSNQTMATNPLLCVHTRSSPIGVSP
jgi:hypothetical protein